MRNSALNGLLTQAKNSDLADAAWDKDSQDEMFRLAAIRWWARHDRDKARAKCLEILKSPPNEPLWLEAIRQLGGLKDSPGNQEVFDALMAEAKGTSYGTRMAAVDALATYGDKRAIAVIEPLTKSSLFFTRRAAKGAIARLERAK
jgi:HEAT repeat protein